MKMRDRELVQEYINYVAGQMRLRDWEIIFSEETPQESDSHAGQSDVLGSCERVGIRKLAYLRLRVDFPIWDPAEFRYVITHELTHCHLFPLRDPLANLETIIGTTASDLAESYYTDVMEIACDGLAMAIAPFLMTFEEWEEAREE